MQGSKLDVPQACHLCVPGLPCVKAGSLSDGRRGAALVYYTVYAVFMGQTH
jgi:hypothetical protein